MIKDIPKSGYILLARMQVLIDNRIDAMSLTWFLYPQPRIAVQGLIV